jgi:hypothetical protein
MEELHLLPPLSAHFYMCSLSATVCGCALLPLWFSSLIEAQSRREERVVDAAALRLLLHKFVDTGRM